MTNIRYRLAPQMADYDRLGNRMHWLPFLMFFHTPFFQSASVNTDGYGFRTTLDREEKPVPVVSDCGTMLLTGGSTAFGVGATSDRATIASRLCSLSGEQCINFGGRAFTGLQELILYLAFRDRLPSIRTIVVMSGINDLYLYYAAQQYDEALGACFFESMLRDAVGRVTAAPTTLNWRRRLARWVFSPLVGSSVDFDTVSRSELLGALRHCGGTTGRGSRDLAPTDIFAERRSGRDVVLDVLARNIRAWRDLAVADGVRVLFVMQPVYQWAHRIPVTEERELISYLDTLSIETAGVMRHAFDDEHRDWFRAGARDACNQFGVQFVDLGERIDEWKLKNEWLFVDRVHLTDRGYEFAADVIWRELGGGA